MNWTQEEILEYNKRCAESLGMYDYSKDNEYFEKNTYYAYPDKNKNPGSGYYTILQKTSEGYMGIFCSDWNWIMKVVEAIKKLGYWVEIVSSNLGTKTRNYPIIWCEIGKENHTDLLLDDCFTTISRAENLEGDKKEAVVQAINQFLIWYEQNK